ncbi:Aste57867_14802 [Aphanomyces stellatus]|uniref:Aste57867_14802 protein n=1 Tax=Aphanomyces stellatus TaxID=120398 RepID=A0A485L496_9STRA|nr:hypothetical protein As57867_014747 [Aphanomyces stellatus]VFT91620.1 Aste57867_14802 [Aphanomyces stellatus]
MKKVNVPLSKMVKALALIVGIDLLIVVVWLIADFPKPTTTTDNAAEFVGTVDHTACHSKSFIFTALTIFWKAIVLFGGMYISFLIRHADADFQESVWIFGSACVILLASLIMLPLAFLVTLPPTIDLSFRSATILLSTVILICLMFGPKFAKLNLHDTTSTETGAGTRKGSSQAIGSKVSGSRHDAKPSTSHNDTAAPK